MAKVIKVKDLEGKKLLSKVDSEGLRGNIVVLNPESSEIAEHLKITEKGAYALKN